MIERKHQIGKEFRRALYSDCEKYRYLLEISWINDLNDDIQPPKVCQFIGLNPSTATELVDDPTVRRCKDFARSWGCNVFRMTNLFAYRSTDPKALYKLKYKELIIMDNIHQLMRPAYIKVAAWGKLGSIYDTSVAVKEGLPDLKCLGLNKDGSPKHPLYLRKDSQLIDFI